MLEQVLCSQSYNVSGKIFEYIGAAYILWLAVHIAVSNPTSEEAEKSASFWKGFMLQFVNVGHT